jgi:hypothetical protein
LIERWTDGQDDRCIFWLDGLAGTGKSTIARTVARKCYDQKRLGASFFFSRGGGDVGDAGKFCTSIAVQISGLIPTFKRHVCDSIIKHSNIASLCLNDQWHELVLEPLSKLSEGESPAQSLVIVIDALDECSNEDEIGVVLQLLSEVRQLKNVRLRTLLTSRPELPVRYGFRQISDAGHYDFVLHDKSSSIVDCNIPTFFEHNLGIIRQKYGLDLEWPDKPIVQKLVQNANGLFIWAATACRFIREGRQYAPRRLDTILRSTSGTGTVTAPEKHLDEIYTMILLDSVPPELTKEEKTESYRLLRQVLGAIVILFTPLCVKSLVRVLCISQADLGHTIEDLHSILAVPRKITQLQPLRIHHPSFRDFLLDNNRCKESYLWVEEKQAHHMLARNCVRLMSTVLKRDLCGVGAPGKGSIDIGSNQIEQHLPAELQYACLY